MLLSKAMEWSRGLLTFDQARIGQMHICFLLSAHFDQRQRQFFLKCSTNCCIYSVRYHIFNKQVHSLIKFDIVFNTELYSPSFKS
jgi:hypothetical protein